MKKILLFGPIGDFGGRELEVGFIADALSQKYLVDVCSTSSFSNKSQVFEFNTSLNVFSLNSLLYHKKRMFKMLSYLSYLKNKKVGAKHDYVNNALLKKYFNYDEEIAVVLESLVKGYDAIFVCAQLCSGYVEKSIFYAKKHKLKVFFRTTGLIKDSAYDFITDVDCFIHHSLKNARAIPQESTYRYTIIDQFANNENHLLNLPITVSEEGVSFGVLGRFSEEKGILKLANYLSDSAVELYIAGDGPQKQALVELANEAATFHFLGQLEASELDDFYAKIDVLIIPSLEEAGPLVGLEAMAAGKVIFSTKVGAMEERLTSVSSPFWFSIDNLKTLDLCMSQLKAMQHESVIELRHQLRRIYVEHYKADYIAKQYVKLVSEFLN
ncbi:hypothetical protein DMZ43_11185 [Meridianimaribacter sp. CL38]|uniref:glycosyltransferase family 4 protein n=1 Tax=Meridianimaribacter sp. CL38 TaxID=2213021 RepID=UPI00103AF9D5|nr:glycosyltransferase [Meridianimaribacter sp. CL38]TBV25502.1 hypothetical protein DMZ43_11185 [Meridianimaribacter sp. CL38]